MNEANIISAARGPVQPVGIRGFGYYVPERLLTNEDLAALGCPVTPDWIVKKTGISTRYVAEDSQAMSDLATPAAKKALENARLGPDDIDTFVVSGDYHDSGGVKSTSGIVSQNLGVKSTPACFDLRAGCPSSVLSVHQALAYIASGLSYRLLLSVAEINTRGVDYNDLAPIWFGDGAAAVILQRCSPGTGILATFAAGTGKNADILTIPAGGSREPTTVASLEAGRHHLFMDGKAVFPFAVEKLVTSLKEVTGFLGMDVSELDWIVPHQANRNIIKAGLEQLGIPISKAYLNLARYGNTAGPSALLALAEALNLGIIRPGQLVALVGFGGGLAWGAQVIRINYSSDFLDF